MKNKRNKKDNSQFNSDVILVVKIVVIILILALLTYSGIMQRPSFKPAYIGFTSSYVIFKNFDKGVLL